MARRPVRFFRHVVEKEGQIWLDEADGDFLESVTWNEGPREWVVIVAQYGPEQIDGNGAENRGSTL